MIEGIVLMVAFIGGSGLVLRHVVAFELRGQRGGPPGGNAKLGGGGVVGM